jgi:hypothetical protein
MPVASHRIMRNKHIFAADLPLNRFSRTDSFVNSIASECIHGFAIMLLQAIYMRSSGRRCRPYLGLPDA